MNEKDSLVYLQAYKDAVEYVIGRIDTDNEAISTCPPPELNPDGCQDMCGVCILAAIDRKCKLILEEVRKCQKHDTKR